jgi:hypothetical protein
MEGYRLWYPEMQLLDVIWKWDLMSPSIGFE